MDIVAPEVAVFKTEDYNKFEFNEANRPIISKVVTKMAERMEANNWLQYCPILVSPEFVVIDGQHRLRAAQLAEATVYYIIAENIDIADIAEMNRMTSIWTSHDYLNYWIVDGKNAEYIKLKEFLDAYPMISLSAAIFICADSRQYGMFEIFREGLWEFGDEDVANEVGSIMELVGSILNSSVSQAYARAIKSVVEHPKYDGNQMRAQLERVPNYLVNVTTKHAAVEILQSIYNYNMKKGRVSFIRV